MCFIFFFFNDTATTEIYTLSLHDALPISVLGVRIGFRDSGAAVAQRLHLRAGQRNAGLDHFADLVIRSEEHTSELQSHLNLVCRLLLEKKKRTTQRSERQPRRHTGPYPRY